MLHLLRCCFQRPPVPFFYSFYLRCVFSLFCSVVDLCCLVKHLPVSTHNIVWDVHTGSRLTHWDVGASMQTASQAPGMKFQRVLWGSVRQTRTLRHVIPGNPPVPTIEAPRVIPHLTTDRFYLFKTTWHSEDVFCILLRYDSTVLMWKLQPVKTEIFSSSVSSPPTVCPTPVGAAGGHF